MVLEQGPKVSQRRTDRRVVTLNRALVGAAGVGVLGVIAGCGDVFYMQNQIDEELGRREYAGLLPPAPDPEVVNGKISPVDIYIQQNVRPTVVAAVAIGESSVLLEFPDVVRERQQAATAAEAKRIRADARYEILIHTGNEATGMGLTRRIRDGLAMIGGLLAVAVASGVLYIRSRREGTPNINNNVEPASA